MRHKGKVVLITGGASGIGRAASRLFADEGAAQLLLVDRSKDGLEAVAAELADRETVVRTYVTELTDFAAARETVQRAADEAGQLDVVISNAGWSVEAPFLEVSQDQWDRNVAINLSAGFAIGQAGAQEMIARGTRGVILFTTSPSGRGGMERLAPYCAAKSGLANLVQTMAMELARHGIRVCAVSPGPTDTPLAVSAVGEEVFERFRESFPLVPIGRIAQPEEIAGGFVYLASDEASYVTGIELSIDGGATAFATGFAGIPGGVGALDTGPSGG